MKGTVENEIRNHTVNVSGVDVYHGRNSHKKPKTVIVQAERSELSKKNHHTAHEGFLDTIPFERTKCWNAQVQGKSSVLSEEKNRRKTGRKNNEIMMQKLSGALAEGKSTHAKNSFKRLKTQNKEPESKNHHKSNGFGLQLRTSEFLLQIYKEVKIVASLNAKNRFGAFGTYRRVEVKVVL